MGINSHKSKKGASQSLRISLLSRGLFCLSFVTREGVLNDPINQKIFIPLSFFCVLSEFDALFVPAQVFLCTAAT
jgi:hypothetical protein